MQFTVKPVLREAPESCWPFVVDCVLSTELESDVSKVGVEEVTFTITFNRDMNTSVQPRVFFGPDDPVTGFTLLGDWNDPRTWIGKYELIQLQVTDINKSVSKTLLRLMTHGL